MNLQKALERAYQAGAHAALDRAAEALKENGQAASAIVVVRLVQAAIASVDQEGDGEKGSEPDRCKCYVSGPCVCGRGA